MQDVTRDTLSFKLIHRTKVYRSKETVKTTNKPSPKNDYICFTQRTNYNYLTCVVDNRETGNQRRLTHELVTSFSVDSIDRFNLQTM